MRVVYKDIIEKINKLVHEALAKDLEIDYIYLNRYEWDSVLSTLWNTLDPRYFQPYTVAIHNDITLKPGSFYKVDRPDSVHIKKTKEFILMGVKIRLEV